MTTLAIELRMVSAQNVQVTDDALIVDLSDGRTVSIPLAWFPRLLHRKPEERNKSAPGQAFGGKSKILQEVVGSASKD